MRLSLILLCVSYRLWLFACLWHESVYSSEAGDAADRVRPCSICLRLCLTLALRLPVEPEPPQIVFASVAIASGRNLTARLEDVIRVECSSAGGNPPAAIRWFVGKLEMSHRSIFHVLLFQKL